MRILLKQLYLSVSFLICVLPTIAQQTIQSRQYPAAFFSYPLELPPTTAGSFGELRSNHFHSGLDFKTNQRTGIPVHAVADGYISRLRVQFGGFGNAVYITHPNGYTTVYGHLEKLAAGLAKIVHDAQYQQQSFEVDVNLPPTQVLVCKGEVFAWSGNAGASAGPHLHFEIRDAVTQETINPQLFGLTIPDKVPPVIGSLYIYHLNGNPFSEKTHKDFYVVKRGPAGFTLLNKQTINLSGQVGFGITAYDVNSSSANHNGVYSIQLRADGKPVYTFAVERFAFDQTHAINAHIDFPEFEATRREIQKSFILPGNKISVYPQAENRGIINFNDDRMHELEYVVKDIAGNTSTLKFKVKAGTETSKPEPLKTGVAQFKYDQVNEFKTDVLKVSIPQGNLYDDLDFNYSTSAKKPGAYSVTHHVHNRLTPIHDNYDIWIKPDANIGNLASKAVIVTATGVTEGNVFEDGYIKAKAHNFGDFYIMVDTIAPHIAPLNITDGKNMAAARGIFLRIGDNLSGIKSYSGKIDGRWVLMVWDYKTKVLSFTFDDEIKPGKHVFNLTVTDNKDNSSQFTANFYK